MSRADASASVAAHGFPRVSGDEPTLITGITNALPFSPRERG